MTKPGPQVTGAANVALLCYISVFFMEPRDALVGEIGGGPEKRARNCALITMSWSAANFIGPVMAGLSIDHIGQRQAYLVLAAFTLAPVLVLAFKPHLLPRKGAKHKDIGPRGSVMELWRMPSLRVTIIAAGIVGSAQDLFQFYMPIYGHSIGLSASAIGTILGVCSLAAFVIRSILPFLAKKASEAQILGSAIFTAAFAFVLSRSSSIRLHWERLRLCSAWESVVRSR